MIVVSLFDYTANMVKPWADDGYDCVCVDLQHTHTPWMHTHIKTECCDVLDYLPPREEIAFMAAFPPCTHLAVSGARWFKGKGLGALSDSIKLFAKAAQLCEWSGAPYMIENPVSTISTYWRKPDHAFDPWQYGADYCKKTCLWTGGGFVMPAPTVTEKPEGCTSKMHLLPPSDDRANLRSETPMGFATAVFNANRRAKNAL